MSATVHAYEVLVDVRVHLRACWRSGLRMFVCVRLRVCVASLRAFLSPLSCCLSIVTVRLRMRIVVSAK